MTRFRMASLLALVLLLLLLGSCASVPAANIRGVPRRADGGEPAKLRDADTALLEKLRHGEISVDEGTLPEIRVNLCAIGDIMAHTGTYEAAQTGDTYNFDYMFADIAPYVAEADYIVGNLETVFAGRSRRIRRTRRSIRRSRWANRWPKSWGSTCFPLRITTAWTAASRALKRRLISWTPSGSLIPGRTGARKKAKNSSLRRLTVHA